MRASSGVISDRMRAYAGWPSSVTVTSAERCRRFAPSACRDSADAGRSGVACSPRPRTRHANDRRSAAASEAMLATGSPFMARLASAVPPVTVAPTDHDTACHHDVTTTRAMPGTARTRLTSWSSDSVISHSKDRQVDEAREQAQRATVQEQQPLILLDRRPEHLDELVRPHLLHLRGDERIDLLGLLFVELRVGECDRGEVGRLGGDRGPDRVVLLRADRHAHRRPSRAYRLVDRRTQVVLEHLLGPIR